MKKILSLVLALAMVLAASSALATSTEAVGELQPNWWVDADVKPSESFYVEGGLTVTALGIHFNQYPTTFDGGYYLPTLEKATGVHFDIDWRTASDYNTQLSAVLALGADKLPDILQAGEVYGIEALANDGAIIALDDYLDLIPNVVAAVGDQITDFISPDGHVYAIPTIVNVPGSQTMGIRQDWVDDLKAKGVIDFDTPETWEQWKAYWYGVRDNDMNGNGDATDEIPLVLEMGESGERALHALLNAFGIKTSNDAQFCLLDDGTYTMVYDHPRYQEFLTEAQKLYADRIIDQEFATRKQADMYNTMSGNLAGSCFTWAEQMAVHAETLRANGDEDALYQSVSPIDGPHGDQFIQRRQGVTRRWCISVNAEKQGKVEDILKFWNWQFSEEGTLYYNYGIEGYTYDMVNGVPTLKVDMLNAEVGGLVNSFNSYRTIGMEMEPFGGNWETNAFMQVVFAGKTLDDLSAPRISFYQGLNADLVNKGCYYAMPPTLATEEYTEYRAELIQAGVCVARDQCVAGQISVEDFFTRYSELKADGLQEVIDAGNAAYQAIVGGN